MSTRAEQKAQTRAALAEATERLCMERGFDAVTIEDIAEAAGVSRRTFFRYFEGKEAAFLHRAEQHRRRFERAVAARCEGAHVPSLLRDALLALCADYQAEAAVHHARAQVLAGSSALLAADLLHDHRWEQDFTTLLEADGDRFTASVRACALMGAIRATLRAWYAAGPDTELRPLAERAFEVLSAGLPEPPLPPDSPQQESP